MAGQGGFGLSLMLSGTAIVGVENVDEVNFSKFIDEATAHDSPGGYYEAVATGKRRIDPFDAALIWDQSEAMHAAIITAFDDDEPQLFDFADPDGDENLQFMAHVERIGRISQQESTYRANITIHPTGTATIT